jgi:minor extracellular serine protease Vpr
VNTTSVFGTYNFTSGTSFAAPHVSGAVALLLQKNPELSPQEVSSIIITTADPISDTYGTRFTQEISGAGRLNITKAFDANLIILPHYAIFELSPFAKTQTLDFELRTINDAKPDIQVDIKIDQNAAEFEHFVDGSTLNVRASLVNQTAGQYQGMVTITDHKTTHHIPILLRISDGAIDVKENSGRLDFAIKSQREWSYAKISVFNSDYRLVDSVSLTPTKNEPVLIGKAGTYWIQADLRADGDTASLYNTILVESAHPEKDRFDVGLPGQQLAILAVIGIVVALVGVVIKRR